MPARDMAAYMRARRARQRAEREAAEPLADATIPRGALLKESAEDLSRIRAKVDAALTAAAYLALGERKEARGVYSDILKQTRQWSGRDANLLP